MGIHKYFSSLEVVFQATLASTLPSFTSHLEQSATFSYSCEAILKKIWIALDNCCFLPVSPRAINPSKLHPNQDRPSYSKLSRTSSSTPSHLNKLAPKQPSIYNNTLSRSRPKRLKPPPRPRLHLLRNLPPPVWPPWYVNPICIALRFISIMFKVSVHSNC